MSDQTARPADPKPFCRCASPLPPRIDPRAGVWWSCSACEHERRYMEAIRVQRGGAVTRCGNCRYEAEKQNPPASVPLTLCRMVTQQTALAGEYRESNTYWLCDPCIDAEIARFPDADVFDGRELAEASHG